MGLAYYRVDRQTYEAARDQIAVHEADILGPRARGYWFDTPEDYPYQEVQNATRQLDALMHNAASEALELSENEASGLSLLSIQLPDTEDSANEFSRSLFLASVDADSVQSYMLIMKEQLGDDPDQVARKMRPERTDARTRAYYQAQIVHLRSALPKVWRFHERAAAAGEAVIVVDLRARDVFIPDTLELQALFA